MSVFVNKPPFSAHPLPVANWDGYTCLFCGKGFDPNVRVFYWRGFHASRLWAGAKPKDEIVAHARCVSQKAPGLLADIAECVRRERN
jgi:hypothetical protein